MSQSGGCPGRLWPLVPAARRVRRHGSVLPRQSAHHQHRRSHGNECNDRAPDVLLCVQPPQGVERWAAIGDVVGNPMLAHKATHEAKVAAEVIAGEKALFDPLTIPSVAYTDPEVAWMGLTETEAKEKSIEYEKGVFPWAA